MYSALFNLAMKYGSKILIGLAAFLLVIGMYFYWENQVYSEGYDKATAEWQKREAEINRKTSELLLLKQHENKLVFEKQKRMYDNAIIEYAKTNADRMRALTTDYDKRLRVKAKCPSGGNPLPSGSDLPGGNSQRGQTSDWAELALEDSRTLRNTASEVDKMASICAQALDFINQNGMTK